MTYQEKLKSPEWFKMRRKVWDRAKDTCELCCEKDMEMHVHHKSYEFGKEPWEYPLDNFQLLCVDCHEIVEKMKDFINVYKVYKTQDCGFVMITAVAYSENYGESMAFFKKNYDGVKFITVLMKETVEISLKRINEHWPSKK